MLFPAIDGTISFKLSRKGIFFFITTMDSQLSSDSLWSAIALVSGLKEQKRSCRAVENT